MNSFFDLLQPDKLPIDFAIILLVLLAGEFQKKYMEDLKLKSALKTLIASAVFAFAYAVLTSMAHGYNKELPVRWFFSYCLATSLYELLFKKIFSKIFGNSDNNPPGDKISNPISNQ